MLQSSPKSFPVYKRRQLPQQARAHLSVEKPSQTPPGLVLDTNAVLDWLVFDNAAMRAPASAITGGRVIWLACSAMRDELAHMVVHPSLARWSPDPEAALATFDLHAQLRAPPTPGLPERLLCSDSDDQIFVDLALACGARWLLTHDRALRKLARRAAARGLAIMLPSDWPVSK